MNQQVLQFNKNLFLLAKEYSRLISLSELSESEEQIISEILEFANENNYLNCLIEEIEMDNYRKSHEIKQNLDYSLNEYQELKKLLILISKDNN